MTSEQTLWLDKYVRESWRFDPESGLVNVKGNITITDKEMEELPFDFGIVTGIFKLKNCSNLRSIKGIPNDPAHRQIFGINDTEFENCYYPEIFYLGALRENCSIEEYVSNNFKQLFIDESAYQDVIEKNFPSIVESHRGTVIGSKFGF